MLPLPRVESQVIRVPGGRFWRRRGPEGAGGRNKVNGLEQTWVERLRESWPGEILLNVPMAERCTLKVGGPAKALALPASLEELAQLLRMVREAGVPWEVMGAGSNILFSDRGFDGVIISLGRKFGTISLPGTGRAGKVKVRAEAGCSLMKLVNWCTAQGLAGLEFAAGIPGSVGGAISMNAGAWGSEVSEVLEAVTFVTAAGKLEQKLRSELSFSYRRLERRGMIVAAGEFLLAADDSTRIAMRVREAIENRKEKQPQAVASAGSFFKNPPGDAAGRLIEAAGLKGYSLGEAMVSPVHANFIINKGHARAGDIMALMRIVQEKVRERFGIMLEPEVSILGDW